MELRFKNEDYGFEKRISRGSDWNFYDSTRNFKENITLAIQGIELKVVDEIVVEATPAKNNNYYAKTYFVKYQKVDTKSLEYFKCILSECKGITKERIDEIFKENELKTKEDFLKLLNIGIKGIGPKKQEAILEHLEDSENENLTAEMAILLDNYNHADKLTKVIIKDTDKENQFCSDDNKITSMELFYKAPYYYLSKLHLGFMKIDEIARTKLKINLDNEERIEYLTEYKFKQFNTKNSNYVDLNEFKDYLIHEVKYLHTDINTFLNENKLIVIDGEKVYLKDIYTAENTSPNIMQGYETNETILESISNINKLNDNISVFEFDNEFKLDETQKEAVKEILFGTNISILTGGAGTGKTTITKCFIDAISKFGYKPLLFAPTGRAAVRMTECTEKQANTIHSLVCAIENLEKSLLSIYMRNRYGCYHNDTDKGIIIIDEFSMVDQSLFYRLLESIETLNQLGFNFEKILVIGDEFQLPSVGPGQVLKDMITSKSFTHVHLTKTFRQAADSLIIKNANKVRNQKTIDIIQNKEFYVNELSEKMIQKIYYKFKGKYATKLDFYRNFQIAVTTNKTRNAINDIFKIKERPQGLQKCKFGLGEKVINLKNDTERGISNGDFGIVENITKKETTIYFYDIDVRITFMFNELSNLTHAYACTIHKLQGSESKSVLIILENNIITDHRLLYTGITRGKENCIILAKSTTDICNICKKSNDWLRKTNFVSKIKKSISKIRRNKNGI